MAKGGSSSSSGGSKSSSSSSSKSSAPASSIGSKSTATAAPAAKSTATTKTAIVSNAASKGLAPGYALNKNTGNAVASSVAARNAETAAKIGASVNTPVTKNTPTVSTKSPTLTVTINGKQVKTTQDAINKIMATPNGANALKGATQIVGGKVVPITAVSQALTNSKAKAPVTQNSKNTVQTSMNSPAVAPEKKEIASTVTNAISPYKFGATVDSKSQATRNASIASDMQKMISKAKAEGKTMNPVEAFKAVTGKTDAELADSNMQNTVNKITGQVADKSSGMEFEAGAAAKGDAYQTERNANLAKQIAPDLAGKSFAGPAEKEAAVRAAVEKISGRTIDPNNADRKNTITKITNQISDGNTLTEDKNLEDLAVAEENAMQNGEDMNIRGNKIVEDLHTQLTNLTEQFEKYKNNATDPDTGLLAKNIADRLGDVNTYESQMKNNNNIIKDTSDRLIRLQSNEAQQGLMRQYLAKGMTEEEARAQSQADMNKQVQLERNTLLQAQKDSAALANQTAQRAVGAKDLIRQAKENNIKYDVGLEQAINQMDQNAENLKYTSQQNNFANYVASTTMKAFNDMTDIEKAEVMATMGVDLADKNSAYATEKILTFLGPDGIKKNARQVFQAVNGLKNGAMDYETALATATGVGNASSFQKPKAKVNAVTNPAPTTPTPATSFQTSGGYNINL